VKEKVVSGTKQVEYLAEYNSLRSEVITRLGLRNQIATFAVIALGTVLTLSFSSPDLYSAALIYPILTTFFALGWAQHDCRIGQIGQFIVTDIESHTTGLRWEGHINMTRVESPGRTLFKPFLRISEVYAFGLFGGSQVLVVALALPRMVLTGSVTTLLILDILSLILTLYAVTEIARRYPENIDAKK